MPVRVPVVLSREKVARIIGPPSRNLGKDRRTRTIEGLHYRHEAALPAIQRTPYPQKLMIILHRLPTIDSSAIVTGVTGGARWRPAGRADDLQAMEFSIPAESGSLG